MLFFLLFYLYKKTSHASKKKNFKVSLFKQKCLFQISFRPHPLLKSRQCAVSK